MKQHIKNYIKNIANTTSQGDAREESYYPYLKEFLGNIATTLKKNNIHITVLPKKTEAGNPDFRIWDGKLHIVGYIEAKTPDSNLDQIENSEQLTRYRDIFPNLILTNFYEFRLYRDGKLINCITIARAFIANKLKTVPPVEKEKEFNDLITQFFNFLLPKVFNAQSLAVELAKRTKFLKDEIIFEELKEEKESKGDIIGFYNAFKKYLIAGLSKKEFADLYSQTICYGLFAARTRAKFEFNRELAYKYIPQTIGILKDVFNFISLGKLPIQMQVIIDDISEVLSITDINKILSDYYRDGKGSDPIIHFYETFLKKYDPTTREMRGVYYTPEPVVKFIVNSIHKLLKSHFKLQDGLASENVTLLDPAAGTVTFPAEAIKLAVAEYVKKYGSGGKNNFIKNQILKNYFAFELMMAAYSIGHLKISFLLEELGYNLEEDDRFKLYLTNTLEMEELEQQIIPGLSSLSEESHEAGKIKKEKPILVILGNPPYSGISANNNEWTEKLLKKDIDGAQSYYKIDDKPLEEKNPKWLQDDYVKFLRFSQWKIHKAGKGIVGMITNHSYLDNPTFRGMRQSLMKTFNEIYILDLHGNSLKKEKTPEGEKDENIFEIMQGVSIAIFIKQKDKKGCKIYHSDLFGLRKEKYKYLEKNNVKSCKYEKIEPQSPYYFFIPRHTEQIKHYLKWHKITDIFPVNSVGIVTSRDKFAISYTKNKVKNNIMQFKNLSMPDEIIKEAFELKDKKNWKMTDIRKQIANDEHWEKYFYKILYRPFDIRWIYYNELVIERTRNDVMKHMLQGDNLGLITVRQVAEGIFNHVLITDKIIESRITLSNKGIAYLFPLYLYKDTAKDITGKEFKGVMMLFEENEKYITKTPNISDEIFDLLKKYYNKMPSPEQILYYIYAILYSNTYRIKYAEYLKIDFPRVPFVEDYNLFKALSKSGKRLLDLHLLKSNELNNPVAKYQGKGDNNTIEKIVYKKKEKRVYINNDKYFEGIDEEVWNYQIGGYIVLQKYLKGRKGRRLENSRHYSYIVTSISKTIQVQNEIDTLFIDKI